MSGPDGFPDGAARLRAALAGADAAVLVTLDRLDWALPLPSRAAPGFVYLAGAVGGVPVGGGGATLAEAAGALAGEASEALAQTAAPVTTELPGDPALEAVWGGGPRVAGLDLAESRAVGVPAAAIHPSLAAPAGAPPRSLGLAAGRDREAARLAALLELVERDAAARWWNDGARPRQVAAAAAARAAAAVAALRAGAAGPPRWTAFLALPSPTGLPVACALAADAGGGGLALGLKAAPDMETAVAGALRELMQMEIALEIARARAARGAPTPGDDVVLRRAALDLDRIEAFAALPPDGARAPAVRDAAGLAATLAAAGGRAIVADLPGPPGGLAVAKALAPGLRPLPDPAGKPDPEAPGALALLM